MENSLGGFASHTETYDVAVIFDKEKGLYAYFLANDSVPDSILARVSAQYPNFMDVVNEFMGTQMTFDEMINEYKSSYLKNRLYSSATVLYCSNAFSDVFDVISTPKPEQTTEKVGRNEPCPCGSGKKFKNCCGKV